MSKFFKGFLAGVGIAALLSVGLTWGVGFASDEDSFDADEAKERCDVRIGYGRPTYSDRCFYDEVMTGTGDGYIRCADVQVDCN